MPKAFHQVAIIDYGLGNLFSIQRACEHVGLKAAVTTDAREIDQAAGLILPGVGAFGDAMASIKKRDMLSPIKDAAASGKPLMGVCLGMQLLMSESSEFGRHEGLDLIPGCVVRFENPRGEDQRILKVPQVGWNRIYPARRWEGTALSGLREGEFMYFVHSFYVRPDDASAALAMTRYGDIEFCSALQHRNIFAAQFHPERSAAAGLNVYKNFADLVWHQTNEAIHSA